MDGIILFHEKAATLAPLPRTLNFSYFIGFEEHSLNDCVIWRLRALLHYLQSCTSVEGDEGIVVDSIMNKARFNALVLPLLSDAYVVARCLTGSRADAEDVVQEACLRAYQAIESVAEITARAWFLTITHNTACTWLRKNRPAALVDVDNLESLEIPVVKPEDTEAETPESALIAKTDHAHLETAIESLPPLFREVIVLRELEGLDYREIAHVTGVPIGTVMSRLARARDKLVASVGERIR